MSSAGFFSFSSPARPLGRDGHARGPFASMRPSIRTARQGADDTPQWLPRDAADFGHLEDQHAD
jgi:hypothetical protein